MVVRGAPAIGVAAAFGMALAARRGDDLEAAASILKASRPTAVNLAWAVARMRALGLGRPASDYVAAPEAILTEDVAADMRIGRYRRRPRGRNVTLLAPCNAGALDTGGHGPAVGVARAAVEAGKKGAVCADAPRPYQEGARLTAWELHKDGIDVTLITHNRSGHFCQQGEFD